MLCMNGPLVLLKTVNTIDFLAIVCYNESMRSVLTADRDFGQPFPVKWRYFRRAIWVMSTRCSRLSWSQLRQVSALLRCSWPLAPVLLRPRSKGEQPPALNLYHERRWRCWKFCFGICSLSRRRRTELTSATPIGAKPNPCPHAGAFYCYFVHRSTAMA